MDTSDHLNLSQLDRDHANQTNTKNLPKILEEIQGEEQTPAAISP